MAVYRIYVEKKPGFDQEARHVLEELQGLQGLRGLTGLRLFNRYDVEGIARELFDQCIDTVFSEPQVDTASETLPELCGPVLATEYLPGQYDQRADSCAQCIQFVSQGERPTVRTARLYALEGQISQEELEKVEKYLINPVESRKATLDAFDTLQVQYPAPRMVETMEGFTKLEDEELKEFIKKYGLAMDLGDIRFCRDHFRKEGREPTITEIRMIDTYWSDHCRHTTFSTIIDDVEIRDAGAKESYGMYEGLREIVYQNRSKKPVTLMDLATIGAKYLKKMGKLPEIDESEEINACSIKVKVETEDGSEDWVLMFKNETHNHPTEIEPFGGAATCIGGAIRDPLSGRSYVYQAMRVTGAADPLKPMEETLPGKLPQRKIVQTAAAGYSSYGNQIGLATGLVHEFYHPGYVAKRMEIGAVVGAAPAENIRRERPAPGDVIVLLGGRTGRDGCGGATGSSKAHTVESLETCGAEVQKGNAPEERKIQRLFRSKEVTAMIKRCNDFGAGGVSVAIGELADGLDVDLDKVPKKYEGLDGTELAISESQERMAVVIAKEDEARFLEEAGKENLEATVVAVVAQEPRLRMHWQGKTIVDLSREFLSSNGAEKHINVVIEAPEERKEETTEPTAENYKKVLGQLNVCSQKGLVQRFDSTIGGGTVLMPFGGKRQMTPTQVMAAKLPVLGKETKTCSVMAYGFDPFLSEKSPYRGAYQAVVESVCKLSAAGASYKDCYLTFQEYFEKMGQDPSRWGKPMAALLGALLAQKQLEAGAIGGKDSMSGSFDKIDVPPTLVSFAIAPACTDRVISPEFKQPGSRVVLLGVPQNKEGLFEENDLRHTLEQVEDLIRKGLVQSAYVPSFGGVGAAVAVMAFGNGLGFAFDKNFEGVFDTRRGAFVLELSEEAPMVGALVGHTQMKASIALPSGEEAPLSALEEAWKATLEPVFPEKTKEEGSVPAFRFETEKCKAPAVKAAKPRVLIPVFPGTNCEYDTARAFQKAGAEAEILVLRNLTASQLTQSVERMVKAMEQSQIIAIPGGFSGGDEPEGSAKFITAFFRNPQVTEGVHKLLNGRDGLMIGICNGFQALIKLGLVPYGEIRRTTAEDATLTYNVIGRHQSGLVRTAVCSNLSPWLMLSEVGDVHTIAISHGEGRLVAPQSLLDTLAANGQIATQYVDLDNKPTMDVAYNPNGSFCAIEAITSPDGRVLGKMGHTERFGDNLYKNVPGHKDQKLFEGAVKYYSL